MAMFRTKAMAIHQKPNLLKRRIADFQGTSCEVANVPKAVMKQSDLMSNPRSSTPGKNSPF
jgi:hypothetical protein